MNTINLWDALEQLQQSPSKETELQFFSMLSQSVFFVPAVKQSIDQDVTLSMLTSSNGQSYIPAFSTKETETGEFKKGNFVHLPYNVLKHLMVDNPKRIHGIALNPFSENFIITHELISAVDQRLEGMTVQKTNHYGKVKLWNPTVLPPKLPISLKQFFQQHLEVSKAWILMAQGETEKQPHWLFLIDFIGTRTALFPQVAEIIKPYMKDGMCFELMQYDHVHFTEALSKAQPIYQQAEPAQPDQCN